MEPTPASASYADDPDIVELSSATWNSTNRKRQRTKVRAEIIDVESYGDSEEVLLIDGASSKCKDKQPMKFNSSFGIQLKDVLSKNHVGSSTFHMKENVATSMLNSPMLAPTDFNSLHGPTYGDYMFDDDYVFGFGDYAGDSYKFSYPSKFEDINLQSSVSATEPWKQKSTAAKPFTNESKPVLTDEIDEKYKAFKQFEAVQGDSDHYYSKPQNVTGVRAVKPSKDWTKKIQHEWQLLEKDLPETIYVRVYEDRMDLLRAVIIGPAGTPYHDGLFFFDAYFPPNYPHVPPLVHYHSGGLRPNPNLYACGKVCLSLLGTWSGSGCEKWNKSKSTMLQVLVSIQALVLNAKPYFNEPGYAASAGHPEGEKQSLAYNESTFLLSCKTMLYSLRNSPKHFEDFVTGHFRNRSHAILVACRAYLDGAQVGCLVGEGVQDVDEGDKSCSINFKTSLKLLFDQLQAEFAARGVDRSAVPKPSGRRGAADTTLKL